MEAELLQTMLKYAHDAGSIARSEQHDLDAHLKDDDSYVTSVDTRLSELAFEAFRGVVPAESIITEEQLDNLERISRTHRAEDELLLIVDPIDGTRNYFHGMPLYGISVALLRGRRPWLGVVTFPGLGETFYADGTAAFFVRNAYGSDAHTQRLEPVSRELNKNSVVLYANSFARRYRFSYSVCTMMLTACVTLNSCWPAIGRGIGTVFTDHIWDFAGSWPILHHLGFELRGTVSGSLMTHYRPEDYDPVTHRTHEPILVCRPEHFKRLRSGISEAEGP